MRCGQRVLAADPARQRPVLAAALRAVLAAVPAAVPADLLLLPRRLLPLGVAVPTACAVAEPHATYTGETRFPLVLQNLHRYFFYIAAIIR